MLALERFLDLEDEGDAVRKARRYFAAVWLVYDALDLALGATDRASLWLPHARSFPIAATQLVLVVCGIQLVRDRSPYAFGMLAVAARLVEGYVFGLNDFFFYATVMLLLAHGSGTPFDKKDQPHGPLWVRWALLAEMGWIYVATGVLKLNVAWLSGGHLFVRTQYLIRAFDWPYPGFLRTAFGSMRTLSALSWMAAAAEITLGVVLWARRPYWLAVLLVVGIHTFAVAVTNVWFFSVAMIGLVVILMPKPVRSG